MEKNNTIPSYNQNNAKPKWLLPLSIGGLILLTAILTFGITYVSLNNKMDKSNNTSAITTTTSNIGVTTTPIPISTNPVTSTITQTSPVVTTTVVSTPVIHVPKVIIVNLTTPSKKIDPINMYTTDTLIINSDKSCNQFQSDTNTIGKFVNVGYSLMGVRDSRGEGACAADGINPSQTFYLNFSQPGLHKLYEYGCLNTQCLSSNEGAVQNPFFITINVLQ